MPLKPVLAAGAAAAVIAAAGAAFAAETIRIETRAFYGATVTMEAGVRVFRPLPADRRVIINPGGKTPLSLSFEDNQSVSNNYNYDNSSGGNGGYDYGGGFSGGSVLPFGFSSFKKNRRGKGRNVGRLGPRRANKAGRRAGRGKSR